MMLENGSGRQGGSSSSFSVAAVCSVAKSIIAMITVGSTARE
jgi:hypothetical protein